MQYLEEFNQKTIYDDELSFISYKKLIQGIYGAPNIKSNTFAKIEDLSFIMEENKVCADKCLSDSNEQTTGIRLIIKTNSSKLAIKAHIQRAWAHQNLLLFNSSGFDIYQVRNGKQCHLTVIAPEEANNIFVHKIAIEANKEVIIYFPTFNKIIDMEIGVEKGCEIIPLSNYYGNKKKIMFYGNSCTQGASASRSGNAYPNIISRYLFSDILNFSFSGACRGEQAMAKEILKYDMSAIIIDFSRNATNLKEFQERYFAFYKTLRESAFNIPIILISGFNTPVFNNHIEKTFLEIKKKYNNTFFINLENLFRNLNQSALSADNIHFTDVGMFKLAEKIMEYLKQAANFED